MKLPKGLYEQLITREISAALGAMDLDALRVEQAPLDPVLRALPEGATLR